MEYLYKTKGVCSREMLVTLDEDDTITSVKIVGGCDGNLQGISALVVGHNANDVIGRLRGISCGRKTTSCPDQLSIALEQALEEKKKAG